MIQARNRRHLLVALAAMVFVERDLANRMRQRQSKAHREIYDVQMAELREAIAGIADMVGLQRDRDEAWFNTDVV